METFEIIKKAVENAKIQSAEITGQIKARISTLNTLGFSGDNCVDDAIKYLDTNENVLDDMEAKQKKQKQKLADKYAKIIQETTPENSTIGDEIG